MKITQIQWISKEALEAIVMITDGEYECQAFCHPCHYHIHDTIKQPLLALDCAGFIQLKNANLSSISVNQHKSKNQFFNHDIIGIIKIGKRTIVSVGEIEIEILEPYPKDIEDNSVISFTVSRLDL